MSSFIGGKPEKVRHYKDDMFRQLLKKKSFNNAKSLQSATYRNEKKEGSLVNSLTDGEDETSSCQTDSSHSGSESNSPSPMIRDLHRTESPITDIEIDSPISKYERNINGIQCRFGGNVKEKDGQTYKLFYEIGTEKKIGSRKHKRKVIGTGSFSKVQSGWLVLNDQKTIPVAIKRQVIPSSEIAQSIEEFSKFKREFDTQHEFERLGLALKVFSFIEKDSSSNDYGKRLIVMERGGSGHLTPNSTQFNFEYLSQQIQLLNTAHQSGYVLSDHKPVNCICDSDGRLKLSDFGTVNNTEELKLKKTPLGSPIFMSPEQLQSLKTDTMSARDIFAAGVSIFSALRPKLTYADFGYLVEKDKSIEEILFTVHPDEVKKEHFPNSTPQGLLLLMSNYQALNKEVALNVSSDNLERKSFFSLLSQMLHPNPEKRISAEAILIHPGYQQLQDTTFLEQLRQEVLSETNKAYSKLEKEYESVLQDKFDSEYSQYIESFKKEYQEISKKNDFLSNFKTLILDVHDKTILSSSKSIKEKINAVEQYLFAKLLTQENLKPIFEGEDFFNFETKDFTDSAKDKISLKYTELFGKEVTNGNYRSLLEIIAEPKLRNPFARSSSNIKKTAPTLAKILGHIKKIS